MIKLAKIVTKVIKRIAWFLLGERWNSSITESLNECKKLFKNANRSVRVVAGELQHDVFDNDQVLTILKEVSTREKKPVRVEIIYGPNPDPKTKRIFALPKKTNGNVQIMQVPERPRTHFIIVDDNRIRIERFHHVNEPERRAYMKRNTMFLHSILAEKFDALKASSRQAKP